MGNTPSSSRITAQDRAILDMKSQRDKLRQYQKRISVLTARDKEIAKECLRNGDEAKALLALRKKKYQESLLTKTDQQLAQLERLTSDVEFALVQKDVLYGLEQGSKVLKQIHHEMGGLERVELIMGESADAIAYQTEISDMLSTGLMSNHDEDEVEDELAAIQAEVNGPAKLDMPSTDGLVQPMPEVTKETPKQRAARRKAREDESNAAQQEAIPA